MAIARSDEGFPANMLLKDLLVLQNTRENIAEGGDIADLADKRVSSLVLEAGVAAVAQPAKYIVPFTALAHTLRILSLSLQIFLEVDHFKMNVPKTMSELLPSCLSTYAACTPCSEGTEQ